jgi:hypothetical protein
VPQWRPPKARAKVCMQPPAGQYFADLQKKKRPMKEIFLVRHALEDKR